MSELTPNLKLFKYDTLIDGKIPFSIDDALNQNWDILDETIGTLPYVKKSGDTMKGDLIVEKSKPAVFLDNSSLDWSETTAPSANEIFGRLLMRDKNNNYTGGLQNVFNTSNQFSTEMLIRRSINGETKTNSLALRMDATGKVITYAPACSNTNSIVTTTGIAKGSSGYVKFGNGIIIQWKRIAGCSNYAHTWTFPVAFTTSNYSVQVTHHDTSWSVDRTVKTKAFTMTSCVVGGNQADMEVTLLAIGY